MYTELQIQQMVTRHIINFVLNMQVRYVCIADSSIVQVTRFKSSSLGNSGTRELHFGSITLSTTICRHRYHVHNRLLHLTDLMTPIVSMHVIKNDCVICFQGMSSRWLARPFFKYKYNSRATAVRRGQGAHQPVINPPGWCNSVFRCISERMQGPL